jgi:hypothetical protein
MFWKFFNILVRFVGIGFISVGTIVSIYGFISLSDPQVQRLDAWTTFLVSLLVVALGFLLLIAPPFRSKISKKN